MLDNLLDESGRRIEQRLDEPVRQLWLQRAALHFHDSYAGIPMTKFPEDLRIYEHLMWESRPEVVVEIGVQHGASSLWFRDRLRALQHYGRVTAPHVVGLDIDIAAAEHNLERTDPSWRESITLLQGDIREQATVDRVLAAVPDGASCLLIEDSAHERDTTLASLRGLARLVRPGGFFVVEDGCVDIDGMRLDPGWPRGVLPAVEEWLSGPDGRDFAQRRELELYGVTCHPGGFLQRRL